MAFAVALAGLLLANMIPDGPVSPNPPKDTDGRREDRGRGDEGATGGMAWAPLG